VKTSAFRSDVLLLVAAAIWGFTFVAQRVGMEYVGPFTFNGVRFLLGALSLLPVLYYFENLSGRRLSAPSHDFGFLLRWGLAAGVLLFCGSSLQQIGLVYTTAGKAGFITGLYIIIVPMLGLIWRQQTRISTWIGAVVAVIGLYFLSITENFGLAYGDFLELIGAFFWAGHVLLIGWLSPKVHALRLSVLQFTCCALLSLIAALMFEEIDPAAVQAAAVPIFYAGILSVGIAYTLQVVAQRNAPAAHAAIILSLEAVFAVLGGWLLLQETLSSRGLLGCGLMLAGMLISQLALLFWKSRNGMR
jgi:drug/metabolite transporter (DMT)-like permease